MDVNCICRTCFILNPGLSCCWPHFPFTEVSPLNTLFCFQPGDGHGRILFTSVFQWFEMDVFTLLDKMVLKGAVKGSGEFKRLVV